jgi:hypothetical protein
VASSPQLTNLVSLGPKLRACIGWPAWLSRLCTGAMLGLQYLMLPPESLVRR